MKTLEIKTPIPMELTKQLHVGDIIYLTGTVITARDAAHKRILRWIEENKNLPYEFGGVPLFHCGPIVKKINEKWQVIAAGPTTSMRMEELEYDVIEKLGVNFIIGKGGMGAKTQKALMKFGAVYGAFPGGAAALAASKIKRVISVEWLDLGTPEALWKFEVEKFGPLVITIDSHGDNLYKNVIKKAEKAYFSIV
ncbi:MAG: FumA C-terminus/TtdB family hydratase beta subunit [Candidatus Odinarchaeia archaeon]